MADERHLAREHRPEALGHRGEPRTRTAGPARRCPLVLITYAATEASIRAALDKIAADGLVSEPPQVIRIERE